MASGKRAAQKSLEQKFEKQFFGKNWRTQVLIMAVKHS